MCTARQVTRGVSPSTSHTPGPLPGSKIAPIGTCSAGADRPSEIWMEMVEPSGASARAALQHVPSLERPSLTVCGVRQLAKFRGAREPTSIQGRAAGGSDRRAQGFGEFDDRLAASGMRHTDDHLAGNDDLPRLCQSLDHHTVRISKQDSVARLVAGNVGLGSGRIELRSCRLGGSLGLVIVRCRNRAAGRGGRGVAPRPPRSGARAPLRRQRLPRARAWRASGPWDRYA